MLSGQFPASSVQAGAIERNPVPLREALPGNHLSRKAGWEGLVVGGWWGGFAEADYPKSRIIWGWGRVVALAKGRGPAFITKSLIRTAHSLYS